MSRPLLSVVIPAFNEERRLRQSLDAVVEYFRGRGISFEIVLVDDGSVDGTYTIAHSLAEAKAVSGQLRILRNSQNRGKGFSVRRGMLEALGQFALLTDADLSTPIEEFTKLEQAVINGSCDLAFGSRDTEGAQVLVHQSWIRENSGKTFNHLVRLATPLPYRDTQCGFKLFKMASCRTVFERQKIRRYAFDVELLYIARLQGLEMEEVPVVWRHSGGSKVHLFPDGPRMILDLLRVRWNGLRGAYTSRPTGHRKGEA